MPDPTIETTEPTADEIRAAKRVALVEKRAERERQAANEQADHELKVLELEDEWSQKLGKRGRDFEIVNEDNMCGEGPIVLKCGDLLKHKQFMAKAQTTIEDNIAYVVESVVYPDRAVFNAIATRRPEIAGRCAIAMNKLYGFSDLEIRKK